MKFFNLIAKIYEFTITTMAVIAGILLVSMILSVGWEVVTRYFLNNPTIWVIEISEYILLYMTFLVGPWILRQDKHIKVDIFLSSVSPKSNLLLNSITSCIGTIACSIVFWWGALITWDNLVRGVYVASLLEPPKGLLLAVIPIGSFFLTTEFLRKSYTCIKMWKDMRNK